MKTKENVARVKSLNWTLIKQQYEAGRSTIELGQTFEVNSNTIARYLKKMGIVMRPAMKINRKNYEKQVVGDPDFSHVVDVGLNSGNHNPALEVFKKTLKNKLLEAFFLIMSPEISKVNLENALRHCILLCRED